MQNQHYLKNELYELIKNDDAIFEFLQFASLDGMWYWDLENPEHEWMNAKFWTTLGYDPADMPHRADAWQDIINPDDLQLALDNFNEHCADPNHPYDQIVRYQHKDGSTVWIRCRGLAIRDENGTPMRMLGAHNDITKFKEAELRAKENAQLYKTLIDNQSAYLIKLDLEGNYTYVNDFYCNDFGWPRATLLGQPSLHGIVPEDHQKAIDVGLRCFTNPGSRYKARLRKRLDDGRLKVSDWEFTALTDEHGQVQELICIGVDVTEQVETETALKASEGQFRFIAENTSDGILVFKYDKIVYASPAYTRILGYSLEEEKTRTQEDVYALLHPEDRERIRTLVGSAIAEQKHQFSYEYRAMHKDGHYVWREDRATLLYGDDGMPAESVLMARDITERKQAEVNLLRTTTLLNEAQRIANMGGWELDVTTGDTVWTDQVYAIHEIPLDTPTNKVEGIAFYQPDDQPIITAAITQSIEQHVSFDVQCRFITATGRHRWVRASGYPIVEHEQVTRLIGTFQDITEQKLLEERIRKSEQQLYSTLASMDDLVFVLDREGVFREAYSNQEDNFQLAKTRFLGQSYDTVLPPELVTTTREVLAKAQRSTQVDTFAYDYQLEHDGITRWYSAKATTRFDQDANYDGVTVVARDMTERKHAEDALRESEHRYRLLSEHSQDFIALHNLDGTFVYASPSCMYQTGYSQEELFALSPLELMHPDDATRGEAAFRSVMEKPLRNFRYRFRNKDGSYRWLETNVNVILDEHSGETRLLASSRDITERKHAEAALEQSEAKFRSFVENANDVIFTLSPEGNLLYISPKWEEVKGFSSAGLLGSSFVPLIHPEDVTTAFATISTIVNDKTAYNGFIYRSKHGDGSWHWFSTNGAPILDEAGNVTAILATSRDISSDKAAEQAMQATLVRLEQALAHNNLLMKELHHRVKNNLMIISSLLGLQAYNLTDSSAKDALQESRKRIVAMSEIHELMYRHDSASSIAFDDYLNALVSRMERSFSRGRQICFRLDTSSFELSFDHAIPLGLIINELLTNATKYAFPEAHAEPYVAITVTVSDGLTITVTDNGVGLADERVLETSDSLGMTVIQSLTDQLGGHVAFQNRPNPDIGLQVTLQMPLVEVNVQDKRAVSK